MSILRFLLDGLKEATTGRWPYHIWMGLLSTLMILGAYAFSIQMRDGLAVTGMSDHVSWGLYISNFTFLVGLAAAAVMLVLPAYIMKDVDIRKTVLIGEGVAVAALVMCIMFVTADMGGPQNLWHMIPGLGYFNWPNSMLAWDVVVLQGYLLLNLLIPFYILYSHYKGKSADPKKYLPFVYLSVIWAFAIHLVTAFLFAGLTARPFWNSSLLGPRFLASAFAAGPAFIIIALVAIRRWTDFQVEQRTINKLALIATGAAQINLVMLLSELFKEFYWPTHHSESAQYLFFGLHGANGIQTWIWTAILMNVGATILLSLHPVRRKTPMLVLLSIVLFFAIWIEKGMGLVVPGFIPSPLGEIVEYAPTNIELMVTAGVFATGLFVFTMLAKVAIAIEVGRLRGPSA